MGTSDSNARQLALLGLFVFGSLSASTQAEAETSAKGAARLANGTMQAWRAKPKSSSCSVEEQRLLRELQADQFCSDPHSAICGANDASIRAQNAVRAERREQLLADTFAKIGAKYGYKPYTEAAYDAFAAAHPSLKAKLEEEWFAQMAKSTGKVMTPSEHAAWEENAQDVVARLRTTVEKSGLVSPPIRAQFLSALSGLKLIDAGRVLSDRRYHPELFSRAVSFCARSGLGANAFHPDGTKFLIVCPGFHFELSSWEPGLPSSPIDVPDIAFLIAHEAAHGIDYGTSPAPYAALRSCLDKKSQSWALGPHEPQLTATQREDIEGEYLEEASADTWAAETLSSYVRDFATRGEAITFLRQSLRNLCGEIDTGRRHPSAEVRFNLILGANPRLRAAFGCLTPLKQTACSITGESH